MTQKIEEIQYFIDAVEEAGGEFVGIYNGRNFFKGVGASFENVGELVKFGAALQEHSALSFITRYSLHVDSMGMGVVVAYDQRHFSDEALAEAEGYVSEEEDC